MTLSNELILMDGNILQYGNEHGLTTMILPSIMFKPSWDGLYQYYPNYEFIGLIPYANKSVWRRYGIT